MVKKEKLKIEKLTNHFNYGIIDNTVYLFQNNINISDDELKILYKRLLLIIEDNDVSYVNISAKEIEKRKEFYQNMGFTLSYYDVNKLNWLYASKKDKKLYRCYGFITKNDFLENMNRFGKKENKGSSERMIVSYNAGYVSNLLLLFMGILLLCYFSVQGAIYLVK